MNAIRLYQSWIWIVCLMVLLGARIATADPTTGAHAIAFYRCGGSGGISTPATDTQVSGSTFLAWVGRGILSSFSPATIPTDNKASSYALLGAVHDYSPLWPNSGEALYVATAAAGGEGYVVTTSMPENDEITLAFVEIRDGGLIQDAKWNVATGSPHTSLNVTTTGPATLVAIWCGDSGAQSVTAFPNNGFATIDSQLLAGCEVEVVVATKDTVDAGTYDVTWTATPSQGAHMYLVAVQNAAAPTLDVQSSGDDLMIAWPAAAAGYTLQSTSNLMQAGDWTLVTNKPTVVGPQNLVTDEISSGRKFFRLEKD